MLLLVGFTQPAYAPAFASLCHNQDEVRPGRDDRRGNIPGNGSAADASGEHAEQCNFPSTGNSCIQRLPRARIPFQPVREDRFQRSLLRAAGQQTSQCFTARFRQSPAEFVVILTLRVMHNWMQELPMYWQHPGQRGLIV